MCFLQESRLVHLQFTGIFLLLIKQENYDFYEFFCLFLINQKSTFHCRNWCYKSILRKYHFDRLPGAIFLFLNINQYLIDLMTCYPSNSFIIVIFFDKTEKKIELFEKLTTLIIKSKSLQIKLFIEKCDE